MQKLSVVELRQPKSAFKHAGATAYKMGIHFNDNPYKDQPYKSLWEKGWRDSKRLLGFKPKRGGVR